MPMPASLKQSLQEAMQQPLKASLKKKMLQVCHTKIAQKGDNVGLSFYAFFANKNHDPALLMEAATWWIQTHQLDHFEKAHKIVKMLEAEG
jgi:hypothetical protein